MRYLGAALSLSVASALDLLLMLGYVIHRLRPFLDTVGHAHPEGITG